MVTQNTNPFVLPGFGQTGDLASNPMLASMEMMRKAWEGLATAGGFDASQAIPGSTPEDLERRISDLRAVENWLRMNLSMLGSTIQALEVQRSTLATLQAFVASAGGGTGAEVPVPSPLDVALGIRRGAGVAPSADTSGLFGGRGTAASSAASGQAGATGTTVSTETGSSSHTPDQPDAASSQADTASAPAGGADTMMKSWWDMLQNQFDNLASATAAGIQGAEAIKEAATEAQKKAVESTRVAAEALQKSVSTPPQPAKKPSAQTAAGKKTTAKKAAAKKASAKKASAKKASAKKASAKKSAAKKTAARKTVSKTASSTTAVGATKAAVKAPAAKKSPAKATARKQSADTSRDAANKS